MSTQLFDLKLELNNFKEIKEDYGRLEDAFNYMINLGLGRFTAQEFGYIERLLTPKKTKIKSINYG